MQTILAWGLAVCLLLVVLSHIVERIYRRRYYRSLSRLLRAHSRAFDAAAKQNDAATNKAFLLGKADAYSRASMLVSNQLLECPDPGQDIPEILTLDDDRYIVRIKCAHIDGADGIDVVGLGRSGACDTVDAKALICRRLQKSTRWVK